METYRKVNESPSIVWVNEQGIDTRIDADYYHVSHIEGGKSNNSLLKISEFCTLSKNRFNPKQYSKDNFKYIDISNVDIVSGVFEYQIVDKNEAPSRARKKINKDDIILSTVRPNRNAVSLINIDDSELVASTGFAVVQCKKNVDNYYIFAVLKTNKSIDQLVRKTSGGVYPAISEQDVMDIEIPIPSSEIQKYIGDKVRKSEELREEAKRLNLLCENEIKKVLNLSEGECLYSNNAGNKSLEYNDYPIKNYVNPRDIDNRLDPKSYHPELYKTLKKIEKLNCKYVKLKELLDRYSTGKSSPNYVEDGLPILMTKNIKNNTIDWDCKTVDKNSVNQFDMVDKEEILITTYGGPSIGKVDILFEEISCTFDYTILKIKFNENFNPYFMTLLLRSKFIQNQIRYIIKGTTGITFVIPNEILDIRIPVINKEIQDKIGEIYKKSLDNIKRSKILIEQAKQDVEDLIEGNFDMSKIKENN